MKIKIALLSIIILTCSIFANDSYSFDDEKLVMRDKIKSIQTPVIMDFEDPAHKGLWIFGNTSQSIKKETMGIQIAEGGAWGLAVPEEQKKYCLGAKVSFKTKGYNYFEILPPVYETSLYPHLKNLFPNEIPNPEKERFIPLPGNCQYINVWVAGRNFRYEVDIWLKDFQGFVYPLNMGTINYAGWRNLSKKIPNYIPQDEKYLPKQKPLKFVKYVLRSHPDEEPRIFYIYFDHMKVITDLYIERFDGDNIKDKW